METNIAHGTLNAIEEGLYQTSVEPPYYRWDSRQINEVLGVRKIGNEPFNTVVVFQFSTPSFLGTSKYLRFTFSNVSGVAEGWNNVSLRFSLCTSSANKDAYTSSNNYTPPPDQNRIAYSDVSVSLYGRMDWGDEKRVSVTMEIQTDKMEPNSTYYLIVQCTNATPSSISSFIGAIFYQSGNTIIEVVYNPNTVVYIDNGSEYIKYQCFVDNGSAFNLYTPYLDNGTSWEPL